MSKKSPDEDKPKLAESFIHFQLQVKRKEIEEFQTGASLLEKKNKRLRELKEQLKEEQLRQIKTLLRQVKEQERDLVRMEEANREQVKQALQQNSDQAKKQEQQLAELCSDLGKLEQLVLVSQEERKIMLDYKMVGRQEHRLQIQQLEVKLACMQEGFREMSDNILQSWDVAFKEIDKITVQLIDEKKRLAAERAIKKLGRHSRQEIIEEEWLKKALDVYKQQDSILEADIQDLEAENLEYISKLTESFNINSFLSQVAGFEVSESGPLMKTTDIRDPNQRSGTVSRPLASLGLEVEILEALSPPTELEGAEAASSCSQSALWPTGPSPQDLWDLLYGSQTNVQELDPVHLGPLELKQLRVVGHSFTLHPAPPSP